jgi:hypothetical protein
MRRIVPVAGRARQTALPDARRGAELRRAEKKPECAQAWKVHKEGHQQTEADRGTAEGSAEAAAGIEMIRS